MNYILLTQKMSPRSKQAHAAGFYLMPSVSNPQIMHKNKHLQEIIRGKKRLAAGSIFTAKHHKSGFV